MTGLWFLVGLAVASGLFLLVRYAGSLEAVEAQKERGAQKERDALWKLSPEETARIDAAHEHMLRMFDAAFDHERELALLERNLAEVERALPDVAVAADIWLDHWTDNKRNFLEVVSRQRTDHERGWLRGYGVALNVIMQRQYMAALRRKEDCERWARRAREALEEKSWPRGR